MSKSSRAESDSSGSAARNGADKGPVLAAAVPGNPPPQQPPRWRTARGIVSLLSPFQGSVVLLLLLSIGAVAIEIAPPLLQAVMVDQVLARSTPADDPGQLLLLLLAIVAGLLLIRAASTLVAIWKGTVSSRVGTTLTENLRNALVKKLNELPLAFHDRHQVGMLMSRVAYDTETLHTLVYHMTSGFVLQSMQLIGIGIALFYLNPKLALVTMLPMPAILAGSWYFAKYLYPRHHHYWEAVGRQASALTGMLSGVRVVKAFVQEDREIRRFRESSRRLRDSRQTVDISTSTFTALMGFVFALGVLAVWYIGGRDVLFEQMTLGSLMAFLAYLAMFYTPLTSIAESTTWFSNFFTISQRVFDLLDTASETEEDAPGNPVPELSGRIEFQQVSFGYEKNRPVLSDISFTIEPGQMVGVVGRSGSGKSTLVSLIGRLYRTESGRILVDGIDIRQMNPRELRRRIGMVPQEPFLFRGPVADNITYGNAEAAPQQILRAARLADAHEFVMRMPLAYETQLGEGGSGLSAGERQRLSIARALLFDPAILILDEATSSVDAESERAICDAIRRFSRTRTTIAIAHRLSTLQGADRLLVFDQGRLLEQGTPRELLTAGGLYSMLVRLQGNLRETRQRVEALAAVRHSGNGNSGNGNSGNGNSGNGNSGNSNSGNGDHTLLELGGGEPLAALAVDDRPGPHGGNGECQRQTAADSSCDEGDPCEIRWLDPARCVIEGGPEGTLQVTCEGRRMDGLSVVRAFPASHPREYLSLRSRDVLGRPMEAGMIRSLDQWPPAAQEVIERSLAQRYPFQSIIEVQQVQTSGNLLVMWLRTDKGLVKLELEKSGDAAQPLGRHGMLLVDAEDNYYVLSDRTALPRRQQRLLTLYFGD